MKQFKECMETLSEHVTVTKGNFILSLMVCLLSGVILGMVISPGKSIQIGCVTEEDECEEE